MQRKTKRTLVSILVLTTLVLATVGSAVAHQDGPGGAHLLGAGAFGNIELLGVADVTDTPGLVADVAVNPAGTYAFLANWGQPDCAGPETGGQTSPDAGAWVIDMSDLTNPVEVGFIPAHQDSILR